MKKRTILRPMRSMSNPAIRLPITLPMPTSDPIQDTWLTRTGKSRGDSSVCRSLITGDIQPTPRPWEKVAMFTVEYNDLEFGIMQL